VNGLLTRASCCDRAQLAYLQQTMAAEPPAFDPAWGARAEARVRAAVAKVSSEVQAREKRWDRQER
jgi:hypothetical protein